jgi:glycerol-3-phosphate dehydrogenase
VTPALASSTTSDTARLNQATREEALAQLDFLSYTGGRSPGVPHHRHLSKRQVALAAPSLRSSNIIGGLAYYDGHVDDARYVVTLVRTAASFNAHAANRVRVDESAHALSIAVPPIGQATTS